MTIKREGGTAPKWNRLHEQEMREVHAALEQVAGRDFLSMELAPVWEVLSRWANHRYKVCRNNVWQDEKRRSGGRKVKWSEAMPEAPVPQTMQVANQPEEKLPWE